jgi:hypothetical protein
VDEQPVYQFGHVSLESSCVFARTSLSYAFVNIKPVLSGRILSLYYNFYYEIDQSETTHHYSINSHEQIKLNKLLDCSVLKTKRLDIRLFSNLSERIAFAVTCDLELCFYP